MQTNGPLWSGHYGLQARPKGRFGPTDIMRPPKVRKYIQLNNEGEN